jgi:hypothetical protein
MTKRIQAKFLNHFIVSFGLLCWMMVKFTHYLVTRFNVPVDNWNRDKTGQPTLDGTWMKHRLALFNRYCVPTISGQTEKNFHWIIYCDVNTFSTDKQKLKNL